MENTRFDRLARWVSKRQSRRAALASLLVAAAPGVAAAACADPCGADRCGAVKNACGQEVNCGACDEWFVPGNECIVGVCGADGYCRLLPKQNDSICWGVGEIGICCDGECLRGPCL